MSPELTDIDKINPFIKTTKDAFSIMLNMEIEINQPKLKKDYFVEFDISGVIGLSGDLQGSLALSFSNSTALKVVSEFIGEELIFINNDVADCIGELANIIAGSAKQYITNHNMSISLPTIIYGKNHRVLNTKNSESIILPIHCLAGNFAVEINIKKLR